MNKSLLILAASLFSLNVLAGFDFNGKLNCAMDWGSYNELAKFTISKVKLNGRRDLEVHTNGMYGTDVCAYFPQEKVIQCEYRGYEFLVDMSDVIVGTDAFGESANYEVRGEVDKLFRRKAGFTCFQY